MTADPAGSLTDRSMNWRKSSRSQANGCVEVGSAPGVVGVRDSKLGPTSPILAFTSRDWGIFIGGIRDGRFSG